MDGRQQRGLAIAAKGGLVNDGPMWRVPSQSSRTMYRVNPFSGQCSCPDHEDTGVRCKHVWAVTFILTAETDADGTTTVTRAARLTYSQEWSSYNRAQVAEKDSFMSLLSSLCATVPQPVQDRGRPRLPLADMAFAATFKVYSRFSSRRFSSDLREAQERGLIRRAPHFNSVTNYLSDPALRPVLHDLITVSAMPLRAVESDFAVDSSGFSTRRFDQWADFKYGKVTEMRQRRWIKAHVMVGVKTNIVTAVQISAWNEHDTRYFSPLVQATAANFDMAEISADKAYISRRNLAVAEEAGAVPYIPFKSSARPMLDMEDSPWARMYHRFAYQREDFMAHYHKRSNVETAFSMIKGKFGDAVLSKSPVGQENEVLAKCLAHNVVVVAQAVHELGIEPAFREQATA